MLKGLKEFVSYFSPFFLYYTILYGLGKIYQVATGNESIWQTLWNKYMDYFGENEATHIVLVFNVYLVVLYWGFGAIFMCMQKYKIPKSLANFKIQPRKSEMEKGEHLSEVSFNVNKLI